MYPNTCEAEKKLHKTAQMCNEKQLADALHSNKYCTKTAQMCNTSDILNIF